MNPSTRAILSAPDLIAARDAGLARLEALYRGEAPSPVNVLAGICCYSEDAGQNWEAWLDHALDELASQAHSSLDPHVFRPLCINFNPRGVHFIDHLFGADVFRMDDGSWQVHMLSTPVGSLQRPDLDNHPTWRMMQQFALAFVERDVPAVLFGLPTIASVLNIAVNLYGQEVLLAMKTEPEAVRRDLQVISDVLCAIHAWYIEHIPSRQLQCILPHERCQPPGYGQLCGCTTQLISARSYAEFVAPHDDRLLSLYPNGGMIHLCGGHTQHIPTWRDMKSLRSVQVNDRAARDLETYFNALRPDQVFYVMPCEGMTIERILEITAGRRLVIQADLPTAVYS
ncbi:MAG: hypothetical protein GX495_10455 [Chloroflexi bacterium]|jgi:hypothetical protein|nr:hypothetical protein [Chloroflexota bacterium]